MVPIAPRAFEAERGLIAAVSYDPTVWAAARELLTADDFGDGACRAAWGAACELDADGIAVDLVSLSDRLTGRIETPGAWLMAARDANPSFARWESWADQVRRASVARRAAIQATTLAKRAAEASGNPEAVLVEASESLSRLATELHGPGATDAPAAVRSVHAAYVEARNRREAGLANGVPTGFCELDALTGGWKRGNMVVIGARPSIGKSALATQLLASACRAGHYVAFFSLEMTRDEIMQRAAAQVGGVPLRPLIEGNLMPADEADFDSALREIETWPFEIDERAALLNSQVAATCQRWHTKRPLGLVVLDYLNLARAANMPRSSNRENEVGAVSRSLKALAKNLKCPVVVLAQLNREGEKVGRKPVLADLRESGSIEQDADIVIFLHREKRLDGSGYEDETALCIAKHRNGQTGVVRLRYQGERARFVE